MTRYQEALDHFRRIAQSEKDARPDSFWHGPIDNCDVCSRPMSDETYMIDGPCTFQSSGFWGNLCVVCAYKYSPTIKWGKAQLYESTPDQNWLLVAGGPPPDPGV